KVGDTGDLQWRAHITNVYHQQNGVGAIIPHGSAFTAYAYCLGISDGAYRVEGEATGTTWSGIEMLPPSTIRFSVNGAVAMADPTEHLLFGMGLDMTNLANFKTALIDVRDTGAVWMKLYTMPPEFSYPNNALDVRRTQEGNYICSGSYSMGQVDKGYVMKVDPLGDVLWCRTYADTSGALHLTSVIELPGGDLLAAGWDKYYQCLLLRLGPSGVIIWQRRSQDPADAWHLVNRFFANDAGELKLSLQGRMIGLTTEGDACGFISTSTVTDSAFVPAVTPVVLTNTPFTPLPATVDIQVRTPALAWQQTCIVDGVAGPSPTSTALHVFPIPSEGRVYIDGVNNNEQVILRSINGSLVYNGRYAGGVDLGTLPSGVYAIELPRTDQHALVMRE
ncbi:MAG TPA: hypothetical protein VKG92_08825, partial [Flavobacteriales bacterium]|nr:hypothetical protein [Flavobacteriales bacterium]